MKTNISILLAAVLAITLQASCSKADTKTEKGRYSYAIGYNIGSNMKQENVDLDVSSFVKALEDALKGNESLLSPEETQEAMQKLMISLQQKQMQAGQEEKKKGDTFLAENGKKEGVKTTASGLQYRVVKQGNGAKPGATATVKVHYSGKLIDGTEFDSSYKRGEPVQFELSRVIPGWTEGIQLMNTGSIFELVIPSEIGYGPQGMQKIPGNSVLIFEVELLDIVK